MKSLISCILLLLAIQNASGQYAEGSLDVVWQKDISSRFVLTGSLAPLNDTTILLTASGGLLLLNPDFWIPPTDTQSLTVSCYYSTIFNFNLVCNYDPSSRKSYLLWYEPDALNPSGDTLFVQDSMMCFLEGGEGIILVYGEKNERHFIYQLTLGGLIEVFSCAFPPTQIQILSKNSFLVSYFDKIVYCQRGTTPYIFYQMPGQKEILGFQQIPGNRFYISSEDGIFILSQGQLELQYPGAKGILRYDYTRLYVLDLSLNRITILSGA